MSNLRVQTNQLCSIPKSPIYILQKTWEAKPRWGFVSMSMAQNLSNCGSQWEIPQAFFSAPAAEHRVKIAAAVTRSGSWVLDPWLIFNTFGVSECVFPWFLLIWWSNCPLFRPRTNCRSFFGGSPASLSQLQTEQRRATRLLDKIFRRKDEIFCYICCGRHAFCEESIENEYFMNWYEMVPSTYFQDIHGLERGNSPQLLLKVRCLEIQPAFLASCHESMSCSLNFWSLLCHGGPPYV